MTRDELLIKLRELKPWLEEQGIVNVRLFGSYARDEAGPDSDVDLLVDITKPLGFRFFGIEDEIGEQLGARVEMVTARSVENPYIRHTVERDALVV
ncbi:nucleotidyltransferase family protein [Brevundimonas sp.]|uniref:nucleotidyltransferase family protein n=1 Tax=Brevundimonas sp. TaxID=1871086 RepID=UPI0027318C01|nr:nucleotidyltransferase domain-containing protein [Brevundimonas sp.]MDP1913627.1 nucleotidyltransferase domain-containing protein [Brevundimonas sp.]